MIDERGVPTNEKGSVSVHKEPVSIMATPQEMQGHVVHDKQKRLQILEKALTSLKDCYEIGEFIAYSPLLIARLELDALGVDILRVNVNDFIENMKKPAMKNLHPLAMESGIRHDSEYFRRPFLYLKGRNAVKIPVELETAVTEFLSLWCNCLMNAWPQEDDIDYIREFGTEEQARKMEELIATYPTSEQRRNQPRPSLGIPVDQALAKFFENIKDYPTVSISKEERNALHQHIIKTVEEEIEKTKGALDEST